MTLSVPLKRPQLRESDHGPAKNPPGVCQRESGGADECGQRRAAAVGDTLAVSSERPAVGTEFYVNDAGNQADVFARSLETRFQQRQMRTIVSRGRVSWGLRG